MLNRTSTFRVSLAALALLLVLGCQATPIQNVPDTELPLSDDTEVSLDDVRKMIVRAGASLGWVMEREGEEELIGTLRLRSHVAKVAVDYDTDSFDIRYLSSENLDYKDGKIHRNYNSWVGNLRDAIITQATLYEP